MLASSQPTMYLMNMRDTLVSDREFQEFKRFVEQRFADDARRRLRRELDIYLILNSK